MEIKGTYDIVTNEGTTDDIISVVMMAYESENDDQIEQLAGELKGETDTETCRNIWQYIIDNIRYEADVKVQEVKSPARLIHDAEGDCKSYSILTACILRYLGIDHFFRFVSYSSKKEATHVYIVALIDGNELPIDAVAFQQAGKPFGTEIKYTYKCDMQTRTTQIAYLAGIGDTDKTDFDVQEFLNSGLFDVWTDESDGTLTAAKGYLLSEWDKYWTMYGFATSNTARIDALNKLQYIGAMLRFYNENADNNDTLKLGAYAFDSLIQNRNFDSDELNPEQRDFFSDSQAEAVNALLDIEQTNTVFTDNWMTNVVEANTEYESISGIGSVEQLRSDLKKTGGYYLYTYISDADIAKYDVNVYRKRLIQNRILSLNKEVLTGTNKMTAAEIDNLVYSGCVTTWGATPENTFGAIKGSPKVGIIPLPAIAAAIKVIAAIIITIVGVIKAINSLKAIDKETTLSGAPDENEFTLNGTTTGTNAPSFISSASAGTLIPILLIGGLLLKKLKS